MEQLGTEEVTLIERGARLIPKCEPFVGELLNTAFERRGISVLNTSVRRVEREDGGVARIALSTEQTLLPMKSLSRPAGGRGPMNSGSRRLA